MSDTLWMLLHLVVMVFVLTAMRFIIGFEAMVTASFALVMVNQVRR